MRTPAVSLARLVAFVAVAEAGSFTAAAERLNTTKSAVSQAVAVLERELGAQLLQRSTRKLAITEQGAAFLADCRALLTDAEAAMERARTGRAQPSGTLRLTSTHGVAGLVAGWIATYRERYPAMRIDYVPTDRKLDLIAERFDLSIRIGPMADSSLRAVVLEELELWPVAAPVYLARHGTPRKPADLSSHEWIALSLLPSPWSIELHRGGRKVRVKTRGAISVASNDALLRMVIQGAGISGFPCTADLRAEVAAGRLVRLVSGWTMRHMFLYAAYPGNIAPPAKTRAFIDLAKEAARAPARLAQPAVVDTTV
ncbi:LysR family transcriptional regulator [Steroidobacter flavus]|uniref:LysR family transcriptional regulator n=1 Tax=Steroidobacter flavus TaxID=1842136 RepID=A0ABV8SM25_9GAMM